MRLRLGAHGHSDAGHGRLCRHPRHPRAARPLRASLPIIAVERQRVFEDRKRSLECGMERTFPSRSTCTVFSPSSGRSFTKIRPWGRP